MAPLRFISGLKATAPTSRSQSPATTTLKRTANGSTTTTKTPALQQPVPSGSQGDDRRLGEYSSSADVCPVCRNDRTLQPKLRLLVSACYHRMCESCVDRIFSLGPEPCPVCATIIRKNAFKPQMFESLGVQREVSIRSRVARIFNKPETDFLNDKGEVDLVAYNTYLEEAETIIFDLSMSKDLVAVEEKLRAYETQHRAQIENALSMEDAEKRALREKEDEERRLKEIQRQGWEKYDEEERQRREAERNQVIDSLESSEASAKSIVRAAKKSTRLRSTAREALISTPSLPLPFFPSLPSANPKQSDLPPDRDVEIDYGDALFTVEVAYAHDTVGDGAPAGPGKEEGGWRAQDGWERALRESVMGLWLPPLVGVTDPDAMVIS